MELLTDILAFDRAHRWAVDLAIITITAAAVCASHVYFRHPWWRTPLLWTDRWHVLSFLSWQPITARLICLHLPPRAWGPVAVWCMVLWVLVKWHGGVLRRWSIWPITAYHYIRGR